MSLLSVASAETNDNRSQSTNNVVMVGTQIKMVTLTVKICLWWRIHSSGKWYIGTLYLTKSLTHTCTGTPLTYSIPWHLLTQNLRYDICSLGKCSPTVICSPNTYSLENKVEDICSPRDDICSLDICSLDTCSPQVRQLLTRHFLTPSATLAHPNCDTCSPQLRHLLTPK